LSDIFKEDKNMKRAKRFHMVGLVSLVTLGLLFIQIGFGGAKASAESNVTSTMSNSQSTSKTLTQESGRPWINFRDGVDLATSYSGAAGLAQILERNLAQPLALASADFDEDGVPDLISGYAGPSGGIVTLHRGNVDSIYPNAPEARNRMGEWANGRMGDAINGSHSPTLPLSHSPFLPEARIFEVPEAPEFIGTGDFDNDGHWDIVAAARGSEALYLLPGDGRGGFAVAKQIPLPGTVTTLTTGEINRRDGLTDIVVGIIGQDGPQVLVFEWPEGALSRSASWQLALPQPATALALGQLDDSYEMDLAVAAGSELLIVHGRDRKLSLDEIRRAEVQPATVDQRSFSFTIASLALGDFIWDQEHRTEIAMLSEDGALHLLERTAEGRGWRIEDGGWTPPVPAASVSRSLLVRAKVSTLPTDDLVILEPSNQTLHILMGDDGTHNRSAVLYPRSSILDVDSAPVAVLPMRLNVDALSDLVILTGGQSGPTVALTAPLATFTVTNTSDSGAGSLRQAILDANANPGADTIDFNIPGAGPHTIQPSSALPTITGAVVIDATMENACGSPHCVELDGTNAVAANGLTITAGSSVVRGLVINRHRFDGDIATHDGDGITLDTNGGNVIESNFLGTDVTGTVDLGNDNGGVHMLFAPNNTIGGTTAAARNVISGNGSGIIPNNGANGTVVQGNFIGTDVTGTADLGNVSFGVEATNTASNNTIGGTTAGARSVISGNEGGVFTLGGTGNLVQGNLIGTQMDGTSPLGNEFGVFIRGGSNNTIGGTATGAGNIIAFSTGPGAGGAGVSVGFTRSSTGHAIQANSIFSNAGLGIDLGPDGVTPNDSKDHDGGPNTLQNFPVLTSATTGSSTTIQGTLNSTRNTTFTLEFFSNTACDPSGFGEGETFLGSTMVTTNGSGDASFTVTFSATVPDGHCITATATDPVGNTSEFSAAVFVEGGPPTGTTAIVDCITYTTAGGNKHLRVQVSIVDNVGNVVSGASVSISVTKDGSPFNSATGTTDASGNVTFQFNNAPNGCYVTDVTAVVKTGLTFDGTEPPNGFQKGSDPTPDADCRSGGDNCGGAPF
jgi:hypothetical protein